MNERRNGYERKITHGSLFSGIGGFDLGFQRTGIETIWQVEIDEYCQKVLAKNFPGVQRFADIRECGAHNLSPVDIISGGFPCQPWSVAGKQGGAADARNLWPEMFRIIGELRPRWVVAENVPNLDAMGYLDITIDDLESIGYEVRPVEIPAAGVGASHLRKRIWIVAYAQGERCGEARGHKDRSQERVAQRSKDVSDSESPGRREDGAGKFRRQTDIASNSDGIDGDDGRHGTSPICRKQRRPAELPRGQKAVAIARSGADQPKFEGEEIDGTDTRRSPGGTCGSSWWSVEPDVGRVAHGVPSWVDRLKGLGNAIVPQIAEIIGRLIVESHRRTKCSQ